MSLDLSSLKDYSGKHRHRHHSEFGQKTNYSVRGGGYGSVVSDGLLDEQTNGTIRVVGRSFDRDEETRRDTGSSPGDSRRVRRLVTDPNRSPSMVLLFVVTLLSPRPDKEETKRETLHTEPSRRRETLTRGHPAGEEVPGVRTTRDRYCRTGRDIYARRLSTVDKIRSSEG